MNNFNSRKDLACMRKTKIICTIGPASESEEKLRELMLAGMNVARFNFSHGSHKEQLVKYNRVLKVRKELGLPVATLLDTKGPEIRLRDFEGGKVELVSGSKNTVKKITTNPTRTLSCIPTENIFICGATFAIIPSTQFKIIMQAKIGRNIRNPSTKISPIYLVKVFNR